MIFKKTLLKARALFQEVFFLKNEKQKAWLEALSCLPNKDILALETGRIRNPEWKISDGNSTYFLTRLGRIKKLISIDDDTENHSGFAGSQLYCESYLRKRQLDKVTFINGNSIQVINQLHPQTRLDFVLLDSANDPDLILEELKAVERFLAKPLAVVAIDDVTAPGRKGDKAIPYMVGKGYVEHRVKAPPCDCSYFVIS